jgi:dTDP-4-amino-4,6-dideoxygalactose transaminase
MSENSATIPAETRVPVCDPRAAYRAHQAEIDAAVAQVLDRGSYILGPEVAAFEREFADYLGAAHAVGVASGTDGLQLALRACGVGPADVVLTVSHTAVATVAAIELAGAVPILVDVDAATYTMDPASLEDALRNCRGKLPPSAQPKALVPVHLYGHPADMDALMHIAGRYGLSVIEDCSQAHGATFNGRKVGTFGDAAVFSLYPTKNLGGFGDGGVVSTNDPARAERIRLLRQYGWGERYHSQLPGLNSRLDELQAAILRVRLRYLDQENSSRRTVAQAYDQRLSASALRIPHQDPRAASVYHQYVVRVPDRDRLRDRLQQRGIGTLIHYPLAVHQQDAYRGRLPQVVPLEHTETAAREILSLPMYPQLSRESVETVAAAVASLLAESV